MDLKGLPVFVLVTRVVGLGVSFNVVPAKDCVTLFSIWVTSCCVAKPVLLLLLVLVLLLMLILPCWCKGLRVVSLNKALVGTVDDSGVK